MWNLYEVEGEKATKKFWDLQFLNENPCSSIPLSDV